jgi:hypothetical protein
MKRSRPPRQASTLGNDLGSMAESDRLDRVANYIHRGRKHQGLSNEVLLDAWKQGMQALAKEISDHNFKIHEDLQSEIELRGLAPPYDDVKEAFEEFCSKIAEGLEELKRADPEGYRLANEDIMRRLSAHRKQPKN